MTGRRRSVAPLAFGIAMIVVTTGAALIGAIRQRREPVRVADWALLADGGVRLDTAASAVTILMFADYECPYCATAWKRLRAVVAARPTAGMVLRQFPLGRHVHARAAAEAAVCAAHRGRLVAFSDSLYADPSGIGRRPWSSYAAIAGYVDTIAFAACMRDASTARQIDADVRAANAIDVHGTPAILINDVLLLGLPSTAEITRRVDKLALLRTP